jgi:AraC-like DNA-binding protein
MRTIRATATVGLFDVDCRAPRSHCGPVEDVRKTQIVVPRRGVFAVTRRGERVVAEPTVAIILRAGETYAVDHPAPDGDRCTVLVFDEATLEGALGGQLPDHGRIGAGTQLAASFLGAGTEDSDHVADEEAALLVLGHLARDLVGSGPLGLGVRQRKRAQDTCALLASQPNAAWKLGAIASAMHVSPFHLARQFRLATGTTIGNYILRLRLALVLDRLAEGELSLSRLAADAGFSHHSHLTRSFRTVFGITPTEARKALTRHGLDRMEKTLRGQGFMSN